MTSRWVRRTSLAVAAALLVLAIGVFFAAPSTTYRVRTAFEVPAPLRAADVIREIRDFGVTARSTGDQAVEVQSTGSDRTATQQRLVSAVNRGVDKAAGDVAATALLRAAAARAAESKAETESAALVATTGLGDPEAAYRQRRADFERLQRQRDARQRAGQSTADLDAQIASAQQDVFDLQFLTEQHDKLGKDRDRAARDLTAASETANRARAGAETVNRAIQVAVHRRGGWQLAAIPIALLALVTALIPLLTRPRKRRPTAAPRADVPAAREARVPEAQMTEADALLVEQALIRARARRAAEAAATVDADQIVIHATPHLDLASPDEPDEDENQRHDAEHPLGGT